MISVVLKIATVVSMPSTDDDLHRETGLLLRSTGLRYTTARRAIVELLADAQRPLTIPEMLESQPGLAQSSAYRNLNELITAGVVHRITTGDDFSHYELSEALTHHHHHAICTRCGMVLDFSLSDALEHELHDALCAAVKKLNFEAGGHRLDLFGLCEDCRAAN